MPKLMIDKPGVYEMTEEQYHTDPCAVPSLSASIGKLMARETASSAWMAHPRLNKAWERKVSDRFDRGSVAHALLLGQNDLVVEVKGFSDWRKDAAKQARDLAHAQWKHPCLSEQFAEALSMAKSARAQLDRHDDRLAFTNGKPEQVLIWTEGEGENTIWCRSKLDWLFEAHRRGEGSGLPFYDYKSTDALVGPDDWGKRTLYDIGGDFQDAFYLRGAHRVLGISNLRMRFVAQESFPPHALAVHEIDEYHRMLCTYEVGEAMAYWSWCLRNNAWPGWSKHCYSSHPPPWVQKRLEDRYQKPPNLEQMQELFALANAWMAPLDGQSALTQPASGAYIPNQIGKPADSV